MNTFERLLLWGSTALVALSGTGLAITKYLVTTDDPFAVVNHPWQPIFLKSHVLAAPLLVFTAGAVFTKHVLRQWRSRPEGGRRSGIGVVALLFPMIVSGYLIQVVTGEKPLDWIVAVHLVTGFAYMLMVPAHQVRAEMRRRSAAAPPRTAAEPAAARRRADGGGSL